MQKIFVAIPDSSLSDEQTKRDKSIKIAQFARACSIFRVNRIFVYHDRVSSFAKDDLHLLITLLTYLDTPQYLRRMIYPRIPELEYAGILHPIKAPHHKPQQDIRQMRKGDLRVGVLVKVKGSLFVEAGFKTPIPFAGKGSEGTKVTIIIISEFPNLRAREAAAHEIKQYWGYDVNEVTSLTRLLSEMSDAITILTSRKGAHFKDILPRIEQKSNLARNLLVVFGAPRNGIHEILEKEGGLKTSGHSMFIVNMFPGQATETVRLEEAILGTLAILNLFLPEYKL